MGRFPEFDMNGVRTHSIAERKSLVNASDFAPPASCGTSVAQFFEALPGQFGRDLRDVARSIVSAARSHEQAVVVACGAHVIKCGLSPVLIGLMRQGYISALAIHGAGAIHDVEIALYGVTSESVEEGLVSGTFGTSREPSTFLNCTLTRAKQEGLGAGEGLGAALVRCGAKFADKSLLASGSRLGIPVTVHIAIGTDYVHMHLAADGAAIGETSLRDFRILTAAMRDLEGGGVLLNIGSAVILPEVLLKAMALLRNENRQWGAFLGVDIDFVRSHRATKQIVDRVRLLGGSGISLTGHHELLIPLLAAGVMEYGDPWRR